MSNARLGLRKKKLDKKGWQEDLREQFLNGEEGKMSNDAQATI